MISCAVRSRRGGLISLVERASGREWASEAEPLATFRHQVFSAEDYERFVAQYMVAAPHDLWWAMKDFTKPGLERAGVGSRVFLPRVAGALRGGEGGLLLEMTMDEAATALGAPALGAPPRVDGALELTLQWFDKVASRLPEACWLSFALPGAEPDGWRMRKLGAWVSPQRVVSRGGRALHAVEDRVEYRDGRGGLAIETLDAPLFAPGRRSLLDFHDELPARGEGAFQPVEQRLGDELPHVVRRRRVVPLASAASSAGDRRNGCARNRRLCRHRRL